MALISFLYYQGTFITYKESKVNCQDFPEVDFRYLLHAFGFKVVLLHWLKTKAREHNFHSWEWKRAKFPRALLRKWTQEMRPKLELGSLITISASIIVTLPAYIIKRKWLNDLSASVKITASLNTYRLLGVHRALLLSTLRIAGTWNLRIAWWFR